MLNFKNGLFGLLLFMLAGGSASANVIHLNVFAPGTEESKMKSFEIRGMLQPDLGEPFYKLALASFSQNPNSKILTLADNVENSSYSKTDLADFFAPLVFEGMEITKTDLDLPKTKFPGQVEASTLDHLKMWPFADQSYSFIFGRGILCNCHEGEAKSCGGMEHVKDYSHFLSEIIRVLDHSGKASQAVVGGLTPHGFNEESVEIKMSRLIEAVESLDKKLEDAYIFTFYYLGTDFLALQIQANLGSKELGQ
jgi:hypothetical protein